jgi:hypothetical protein
MRKPSLVLPITIGVLALSGLVGVNIMAQKNGPKTEGELHQEEQEQQAKTAGAVAPTPLASQPAPKNVGLAAGNDLAGLGPVHVFPGSGGPNVTVGYEWTPELQSDPEGLVKLAKKVQELAPGAQLRLVNVDANPQTPAGIAINDKVVAPPGDDGNLGGDALARVAASLKSAK